MEDVFVYGTLKRGFPNYDANMAGSEFVERFQTVEAFPLVVGGQWFTPYLIDEPGTGRRVSGELFSVSPEHLARLDILESTHLPNGYKKREIQIAALDGSDVRSAWAYLKDRETIDGIHCDLLPEYPLDPRYVVPNDPRRSDS